MFFFKSFYNSLWNFKWLKAIKNSPGLAWGYFSLLMLVLSLVVTLPIAFTLPGLGNEVRDQVNKLPNFEATLKSGELTVTGIEQPYVFRDNGQIFVVDTVTTSVASLSQYMQAGDKGGFLMTKTKIELVDNNSGQEKIQSWKDVPDFSTNKEKLLGSVIKYTGTATIVFGFILLVIFFFAINFIAKLWSLLFVVLLAWLVSAVAKRGWKFGELFTVGLFAVTLPAVVTYVLNLTQLNFAFMFFLMLLAFMLAVVLTKDESVKIDSNGTSV